APLLVASFGVAVVSFAFNERVVARATATLDQWKAVDYGTLPIDRGDRSNVWVRDGDDLIAVGQVRGKGKAVVLGDVTIYDRAGG
ncbi:LptF/LptG family permease, partial [Acinetobacter baumannii]|nr:LptF/LptG family permease [Acinetobacter baumannii]